jgi:hypothetical protein
MMVMEVDKKGEYDDAERRMKLLGCVQELEEVERQLRDANPLPHTSWVKAPTATEPFN